MVERINQIKCFMISVVCLAGVLGLTSCGVGPSSGDSGLTESEMADFKAVMASVEEGVPTTMDLTDEVQYRFFIRQLQSAGLTAENSPELFSVIEARRQSPAAENGSNGSYRLGVPNGSNDLSDPNESPTFSITELKTSDGMNFTATAVANLPQPAQIMTLTLQLYDETTGYIFGLKTIQKYSCNGTITLTTTGELPWQQAPGQNVTALLTWMHVSSSRKDLTCGAVRSTLTYQP